MKFSIPVIPVAKGRPRLSTRGGYAHAYTPTKTRNAEDEFAMYVRQQYKGEPVAVPLADAVAKKAYHALTSRDFDFKNLQPRPSLLRYLETITGLSRNSEKPYARFLKKFAKKTDSR